MMSNKQKKILNQTIGHSLKTSKTKKKFKDIRYSIRLPNATKFKGIKTNKNQGYPNQQKKKFNRQLRYNTTKNLIIIKFLKSYYDIGKI